MRWDKSSVNLVQRGALLPALESLQHVHCAHRHSSLSGSTDALGTALCSLCGWLCFMYWLFGREALFGDWQRCWNRGRSIVLRHNLIDANLFARSPLELTSISFPLSSYNLYLISLPFSLADIQSVGYVVSVGIDYTDEWIEFSGIGLIYEAPFNTVFLGHLEDNDVSERICKFTPPPPPHQYTKTYTN